MNEASWTEILSALLTPTIAIFGIFIAYKQWRLAQNKMKMELFDKRYSIYVEIKNFINSMYIGENYETQKLLKFRSLTKEAKWLFNSKIVKFIDSEIWSKACSLQTLRAKLEDLSKGEERSNNLEEQNKIIEQLLERQKDLSSMFSPFLTLKH